MLPDVGCCSNTEEDATCPARAVGVHWRSAEYSQFLHLVDELSYMYVVNSKGSRYAAQHLDRQQKPVIRTNHSSRVKKGLPLNFYCPTFIEKLSRSEKARPTSVPASDLLETLLIDISVKLQ